MKGISNVLDEIIDNEYIKAYMNQADKYLDSIGYTEHGIRHASIVSKRSGKLLQDLGYDPRQVSIAATAGYMHDIGNMISRVNHGHAGALLARDVLEKIGMPLDEIVLVMTAIGNHEEETGIPADAASSALIIADKSDVHRSRVRNPEMISFDIHDRVNYAATKSILIVDKENMKIKLEIEIDTSISQVMEYFEIFLSRMLICKKAARILSSEFQLIINGTVL